MALCHLEPETAARAQAAVDALAAKGYRTLGVARAAATGPWQFLGILPLFDPPREDAAETIADARQHGIQIKMVTGDNVAIAREISQHLGLGTNIQSAAQLLKDCQDVGHLNPAEAKVVEAADGYAEVFPEHKYGIVLGLQSMGHIVGMTGDGVNDAPAIKQADVGIAVSGATDAARAAADLVLTAPGLSVIVRAVEEARRIFERMNSYAIYRIVETIRIMFFVVLAMVFFNFYPITAIMIILLAFFNDVPIMAIAFDNTMVDPNPVRWNMRRVLTLSTVLGLTGVAGSFLMLIIAKKYLKLDIPQIQTLYLSENGRGRAPHPLRDPDPPHVPEKTPSGAHFVLVDGGHQAPGHLVRGVPVRSHHPHLLERRRHRLDVLYRLAFHGGHGQVDGPAASGDERPAAPDFYAGAEILRPPFLHGGRQGFRAWHGEAPIAPTWKKPASPGADRKDPSIIYGAPTKTSEISLESPPLFSVMFLPNRRTVVRGDLALAQGGGVGHAGSVAAGLAVGHGEKLQDFHDFEPRLAGIARARAVPGVHKCR